jgi:carboxymethylenebutenolidase
MKPDWDDYHGKAALIHGADGDGGTGNSGIQQAAKAIENAGGEVTLYDYPGTQHAWMNDTRPEVFSATDAPVAWERTVEFLRGRLS